MADNFSTSMCRLSRNCGIIKLLEPSGPVETCNEMTNRKFAKWVLVWILITYHEVQHKRQKNARNNQNVNINDNMTYQENACNWYKVVS